MNKVIDGKKLAEERQLKIEVDPKNPPQVVSLVDPLNPASKIFTHLKQNKARELGINFKIVEIPDNFSLEQVVNLVKEFNKDPKVTGIMFQLPLPEHLRSQQDYLINLIDPKKDIDGLTGKGPVPQATVRGVLSMLEKVGVQYGKDKIGIVGSEGFVGKALVRELENVGIKVIKVDKKLPETSLNDLNEVDVVISAIGVNGLVKPEHIKEGVVLIDVGLGDFDESCFEKASAYTPPKGGVGPMTIISLMENLIDLCFNTKQ